MMKEKKRGMKTMKEKKRGMNDADVIIQGDRFKIVISEEELHRIGIVVTTDIYGTRISFLQD